ncbi:MAG TPA: mannitol dehydrogenase, partial [Alteromonas australica]|nr:mannitol dehydrogenase [Alteromonas australica]
MQSQSSFRLRQSSLSTLPSHIEIPQYDASKVTTGIVHIGVGGFHRSHEAMYVNNYMNQTGDLSWGICGIGLRDADKKMQDTLVSQDYLYSLVEKHPSGERKVSVIGAICDFMMATENPEAVIDKMSSEDVKIVSLTITEGGYNFDPVTGEFIADNPDVLHDIANPTAPKLVFGYLLAALKARKDAGIKPFTIMSCDNIQHNGDVLKAMVLAYINLVD